MQAGEDKFSTCENLAKRLESVDKDMSSVDVKEVQAKLSEEWIFLRGHSRIGEKDVVKQTDDTGRELS